MTHSLSVVLGNACTFKCRHCAITGVPHSQLSDKETNLLLETINSYRFATLIFVGGEPTLYVPAINAILSGLIYTPRVLVTTNGSFSPTIDAAMSILSQIKGLNEVQLSYDRYHKEFLKTENIENLKVACSELDLKFSIVLTIESPMDLAMIMELRKLGDFPIGVQKVVPFGSAKENGISYAYPKFDPEILSQQCPNKDGMVYVCGRGFAVCDIPRKGYERFFFETMKGLQSAAFYEQITSCTFGELLKKTRVRAESLSAADSSPCVLCEKLFNE